MKITISSPDGLGDFVLRMPLFDALQKAGHELQVLTLSPATEFAQAMLPSALITPLSRHPYSREARETWRPFRKDFARIADFGPDLYVAALFQPSFLDEVWIEQGDPHIPIAGLVSTDTFWPSETTQPAADLSQRYKVKAHVDYDLAECEKNRILAEAILGHVIEKRPLRLDPPEDFARDADDLMQRYGLEKGSYHVVCAGTRRGLEMKDWSEEKWQAALAQLAQNGQRRFAFLGNREESASIDRIQSILPPNGHVNLAAAPPDIGTSFHLIARSAGYIGRDSGLMHLAAASGVPVLAVFGGGHWGRFFPQSTRAVVVSTAMPCQGCNWRCHLSEPLCIRDVTVGQFVDGWNALIAEATGLTVLKFPLSESHLPQIQNGDPKARRHALQTARMQTLRRERARGPVDSLKKRLGKISIRPKRKP